MRRPRRRPATEMAVENVVGATCGFAALVGETATARGSSAVTGASLGLAPLPAGPEEAHEGRGRGRQGFDELVLVGQHRALTIPAVIGRAFCCRPAAQPCRRRRLRRSCPARRPAAARRRRGAGRVYGRRARRRWRGLTPRRRRRRRRLLLRTTSRTRRRGAGGAGTPRGPRRRRRCRASSSKPPPPRPKLAAGRAAAAAAGALRVVTAPVDVAVAAAVACSFVGFYGGGNPREEGRRGGGREPPAPGAPARGSPLPRLHGRRGGLHRHGGCLWMMLLSGRCCRCCCCCCCARAPLTSSVVLPESAATRLPSMVMTDRTWASFPPRTRRRGHGAARCARGGRRGSPIWAARRAPPRSLRRGLLAGAHALLAALHHRQQRDAQLLATAAGSPSRPARPAPQSRRRRRRRGAPEAAAASCALSGPLPPCSRHSRRW